jgi:hypothetical protein
MFHLAQEWGKVDKTLPTVRRLPGGNHRERVLAAEEEALYFAGAKSVANSGYTFAHTPENADLANTLVLAPRV